MDPKKQLIIETAISLFSQKGYYTTSVQEIAEQCGISKGSLYKYFPSKEELFIEVCEYYQHILFEKSRFVDIHQFASKREWLIEQISLQMEDFLERKDFLMMVFKEIGTQHNEKFQQLHRRMRAKFLYWQRERLLTAYGNVIEPYVWDLVISLQGMIKEYLLFLMSLPHHPPIKQVATYIAERLDTIIQDILQNEPTPVMTEAVVRHFLPEDVFFESRVEALNSILEELQERINQLKDETMKQRMLSSLDLLQTELQAEQPRTYLIDALFTYLEKEESLTFHVKQARLLTNIPCEEE